MFDSLSLVGFLWGPSIESSIFLGHSRRSRRRKVVHLFVWVSLLHHLKRIWTLLWLSGFHRIALLMSARLVLLDWNYQMATATKQSLSDRRATSNTQIRIQHSKPANNPTSTSVFLSSHSNFSESTYKVTSEWKSCLSGLDKWKLNALVTQLASRPTCRSIFLYKQLAPTYTHIWALP